MRAMKLRITGKRFSLGSWGVPFARNGSPALSQRSNRAFSSSTATAQETKQSTSQLIELAGIITRETEKLDKYLKASGSPQPSFDVDGPANFPKLDEEMKKAREEVVRATKELGDLVAGPTESIRWMAWDHNNSLSLHAIYHYKIAQSFPIHETATFTQIAERTGLDEVNVRRFMRHAMTNRIFKEVEPGVVAHTAASRVLAEDKAMQDWVGFCVEDIWPAASRVVDAINLNPSASEPTQAGFQLSNNTLDIEPMFVTFGKSPLRAKRMGGAMTSLTGGEGYEVSYLINNYDWASIDAKSGTVVDIGGSHGFVCVELAEKYKNMKFVVQDLPKTVQSAPKLEGDIGERIQFQAHDFHTQQPVKGADVYLYRWILHNQSDRYAINMLKQLIPALKKGARVVINDHCLPEPNTESLWDEKIIRSMDLVMLTLLNARERSEGEFRELFERAGGGFRFLGARRPEGCRMSIIEAVWEGEDFGGEVVK
ncbi:S-adenosyl-L-methionine-dependent methyltransferase [Acephala macrosclerotiorum]|nr:S-adenosyl-L-methionine-dependent methyltransferase [Acephala macrosclerotiorum]